MKFSMAVLVAVLALNVGGSPAWAEPAAIVSDSDAVGCAPLTETAGSAAAAISASAREAGSCGPAAELRVTQDDCTVAVVSRAAWMHVLEPLVPDGYGLVTLPPPAPPRPPGPYSPIFILDQYCEDVVVHGRHSVPTTTTYVATPITTIDGQPTAAGTLYTLYIGTNNPELSALYRSAGLPVEFLPDSSATITQVDSGSRQAVFTIEGGQFDHEFTVLGHPPVEPFRFDTGATWLYEGNRGRLSLVWENDTTPNALAVVSGSIEAGTTLAELVPDFFHTMNSARFPNGYRIGSHIQTLTCAAE